MKNVSVISGEIAEANDTLDNLWAQAEYLGNVEIGRPIGDKGYQASIRLPDWSNVKGKITQDVNSTIADAIRKARLIGG